MNASNYFFFAWIGIEEIRVSEGPAAAQDRKGCFPFALCFCSIRSEGNHGSSSNCFSGNKEWEL